MNKEVFDRSLWQMLMAFNNPVSGEIGRGIADGLEKVFDSLERAPWWREVTDPDELVPIECPVRIEGAVRMTEGTLTEPRRRREFEKRVFIDTRWTPPEPPKPFEIGDVIETVEQAERLPRGAGVIDNEGDISQVDLRIGVLVPVVAGGGWEPWESFIDVYAPLTIIHLPEVIR